MSNRNAIAVIVAAVLIIGGVVWASSRPDGPQQAADQTTTTTGGENEGQARTMSISLSPQNESGESGTATFTEQDGQLRVVLALSGAPTGVAQPAHIHAGSCANPGAVKYPLASPLNGTSETLVNTTIDQLLSELPLVVNVHRSVEDVNTYVSCGDINKLEAVNPGGGEQIKTFNVEGGNFRFSPTEIRVKNGDRVRIVFANVEGFHDWVLDEFNVRTNRLNANQTGEVTFTADRTGIFEYYCSVGNHRQMGMKGNLIVE